jgi:hypothetical protein
MQVYDTIENNAEIARTKLFYEIRINRNRHIQSLVFRNEIEGHGYYNIEHLTTDVNHHV